LSAVGRCGCGLCRGSRNGHLGYRICLDARVRGRAWDFKGSWYMSAGGRSGGGLRRWCRNGLAGGRLRLDALGGSRSRHLEGLLLGCAWWKSGVTERVERGRVSRGKAVVSCWAPWFMRRPRLHTGKTRKMIYVVTGVGVKVVSQ
jgi:hypothetical protein